MSDQPEKKRDSLSDLIMPRDPKLPATQLLEAPDDSEEETTGMRVWPDAAPEAGFDEATTPVGDTPVGETPVGDGVTLDDSVTVDSDERDSSDEDALVEVGEEGADSAGWDDATLVDVVPEE